VLVSAGTTRYPALEEGFGGFGVLWADATDEVWFAKLGPGGSVLDGPYDLGGPAVSDTPGDMALVATSDGFLAAWCGEDGATDRLRTVRIADGEVPDAAVEVDLPGADLCFNPSGAWSGSVAAIAWMALDGADYLPSFVILNADGTEAVAPDSDANVANDRSIDVEWLGEDFGVFFRADIGGLLADGGKYVLVGEDGVEDGVITEFDDDGAAIGADVAWGGTSGIVLWTIAGDDGIQSIGLDAAGNLDGPERAFAPSATYPSVAKGAGGILGAWVTTQPVAAPLGSAALAPTLNLSDRAASSGPPSVAADASGFGVAWSEGNAGLYFNRVECP
jgi:hypothetical protein